VIEIDLADGCVRVRGVVGAEMLREVLAAARRSDRPYLARLRCHGS
jgi:hypothetical protein